jgi:uncharacterized membrane protein
MQCPVCHNEVGPQNAFCNHCGAALSGVPPSGESAQPPTPAYEPVQPPAYAPVASSGYVPPPPGSGYVPPQGAAPVSAGGLSENSAAAIAYLTFIPAIIFLVLEPYNKMPLVRFHSIQCLALCVVAFVLHIGVMIVAIALHIIPLMWILTSLLHVAVTLVIFLAWLIAIIKASKGEWYKLPIIGNFAEKTARG